ncbi:MAG: hypothetical protein MRJ93_11085 [Nitrososphaeraceae archaeon]|nr:hypothetical protein [Nitrososphaeraceae archaeon]
MLNNRSLLFYNELEIMVNNDSIYPFQKLMALLNNNTIKKSILQGAIISSITITSYLLIVLFTSPNLPVPVSISSAFQVNLPIIIGLAIGTGIQGFVISYRKKVINNRCHIKTKKGFLGLPSTGNGLGAALSSFFSFFSLVPLGCCGSWLFILSYLPMAFGTGASVFMIKYASILSYVGLILISIIATISIVKLYKDVKNLKNNKLLFENTKRQGESR